MEPIGRKCHPVGARHASPLQNDIAPKSAYGRTICSRNGCGILQWGGQKCLEGRDAPDETDPVERPVSEEGFAHDILDGDSAPIPAVIAVSAVVPEHVDLSGWNGQLLESFPVVQPLVVSVACEELGFIEHLSVENNSVIPDGKSVVRQRNHPLDVIGLIRAEDGIGCAEYDDIPHLDIREPIDEFRHENAVPFLKRVAHGGGGNLVGIDNEPFDQKGQDQGGEECLEVLIETPVAEHMAYHLSSPDIMSQPVAQPKVKTSHISKPSGISFVRIVSAVNPIPETGFRVHPSNISGCGVESKQRPGKGMRLRFYRDVHHPSFSNTICLNPHSISVTEAPDSAVCFNPISRSRIDSGGQVSRMKG